MPLIVRNDIRSPSPATSLEHIEFYSQAGDKYFKLADPQNDFEIRIRYIPYFESTRDPGRYECVLFENSYLTAENDVFEIYESTLGGRLGWIFPIAALDSNEHNFAEDNSFKHYRHIAYQKLLSLNYPVNFTDSKEEYRISEIFDGVTVCILSKDEIANISNFKITDYVLSFLKYDYLILKKGFNGKITFKKDEQIEAIRKGNHRIKIKKAAFDITSNQYTNSLFIDHVYQTENTLTKYILLYQILEQFIQELGDSLLDEIIKEYQDKKITKNTVKEKIGKVQNDRSLIKKTFEKTLIKNEIRNAFLEKCTFLFNDINLTVDRVFEDAIYDFRNLITHNYRLLTDKTDELNDLVYLFELIIIELLIGFNEKQNNISKKESFTQQTEEAEEKLEKSIVDPISFRQIVIKAWNRLLQRLLINE